MSHQFVADCCRALGRFQLSARRRGGSSSGSLTAPLPLWLASAARFVRAAPAALEVPGG